MRERETVRDKMKLPGTLQRKGRVFLILFATMTVAGIVTIGAFLSLTNMERSMNSLNRREIAISTDLKELRGSRAAERQDVLSMLLTQDRYQQNLQLQDIVNRTRRVDAAIERLSSSLKEFPDLNAKFQRFLAVRNQYVTERDQKEIPLIMDGDPQGRAMALGAQAKRSDELRTALDDMISQIDHRLQQELQTVGASAARILRTLLALGTLCFLLTGALAFLLRRFLKQEQQAEREMRARNDLLTVQQQSSPDDIMAVDAIGTILFYNRRYDELWGLSGEEVEGRPFMQVIQAFLHKLAEPEAFLQKVRYLMEHREERTSDEIVLKDGTVFDRYTEPLTGRDGHYFGRIWYLRDITGRKEAERALLESESNFRGLLESAADGMLIVNEAHEILMVNEQLETMFGYHRSELIGKYVGVLIPSRFSHHADYARGYIEAPRKRLMGKGLELFGLRKDGTEFSVEISLSPMQTSKGLIVSAAIRDITDRKLAEKKLSASAAYARSLFEASLDPMVTISLEGKMLDVNEAMVRFTGNTREGLLGADFAVIFTEPEKAREVYRQTFATGYIRDYPLTLRDASGRVTDVLFNATVYRNEAGEIQGAFAAARDITQRKRMEDEVKELNRVLEQRVAERTEYLSSQTQEILEAANVLAAASSQIKETTNQVVTAAIETAGAVSETTSTVEEVKQTALVASQKARNVSDTAQKTVQVAQRGRKAVEESISGMGRIQDQVESIADSIIRLAEQSQTIGEIIATVNDLAEQSNLLAVNAAIEAAKAGEQGKGFAVVAQEVKSLAEQSKEATAQVRTILNDIQKATNVAVMVTEQGNKAVQAGVQQSKEAGDAIRQMEESIEVSAQAAAQIAASGQQQLSGMDQVAQSMENIKQASEQNVTGMKQVEATLQNLHELGQKLKQLVERYKV
ncbi:PAS domain S-box protein [Geomonas sp. RF6]|uniref:PAS domain S-box protein n=1 Tax=Geomonas sp. RF6 TaxID=2897342 RepID=UPI001E34AFCA|nr:PAS domain S-box protein [Geomonas sp. RF6]UFS69418.1 PAS domain S-box protein [Geomonas sp. RF6]